MEEIKIYTKKVIEISCRYCGHYDGGHNLNCPVVNKHLQTVRLQIWQYGWNKGREGKPYPTDLEEVYIWAGYTESTAKEFVAVWTLGYIRGTAALEEAENSVPW